MNNIKISYLKIGINCQILDYNKNFVAFLGIREENWIGSNFNDIIQILNPNVYKPLKTMTINETVRILLFRNNKSTFGNSSDFITIIYALIKRVNDGYIIKFVNWTNWIHSLYNSLESGFYSINNLNESAFKSKIKYLNETYWFKALLPLLAHVPKNLLNFISTHILFKVLRVFNNKRGVTKFSKDYSRDTISRIRTQLRKNTGIMLPDISTLITNDSLIDINRGKQLVICETSLFEDILIFPEKDEFLEFLFSQVD